jgi:hypothetical protein
VAVIDDGIRWEIERVAASRKAEEVEVEGKGRVGVANENTRRVA